MLDALPRGSGDRSLGADKSCDAADLFVACRQRYVSPHVARNDNRIGRSPIDGRTTRHAGHRLSRKVRKRIEEHSGQAETFGRIRRTVLRGLRRVDRRPRCHSISLPACSSNDWGTWRPSALAVLRLIDNSYLSGR